MDKNNWNAIKETLLLLNQGIDKQIKERVNYSVIYGRVVHEHE